MMSCRTLFWRQKRTKLNIAVFSSLRGAGAVLVRVRVRFAGAGAGAVLVRVKILRCGFASAGAGAVKFFGAGNNTRINDL